MDVVLTGHDLLLYVLHIDLTVSVLPDLEAALGPDGRVRQQVDHRLVVYFNERSLQRHDWYYRLESHESNRTHHHQKLSVWSFLHGVEELVDGHVDDALLSPTAVHGVSFT